MSIRFHRGQLIPSSWSRGKRAPSFGVERIEVTESIIEIEASS
jgi:hypothetical protein